MHGITAKFKTVAERKPLKAATDLYTESSSALFNDN